METKNTPTDIYLQQIFAGQLQEIYWTERKLEKRLTKLTNTISDGPLRQVVAYYIAHCKAHNNRLEVVFAYLKREAGKHKSPAVACLLAELKAYHAKTDSDYLNTGLVFSLRKVIHLKLAVYSGLACLAESLQFFDAKDLMEQCFHEETNMDESLLNMNRPYEERTVNSTTIA